MISSAKTRNPCLLLLGVMVLLAMSAGNALLASESGDAPPPAPIRHPAEFEPMQGAMIGYPFGVPMTLIKEIAEDAELITVVADIIEKGIVEYEYDRHGVNLDNCSFLIAPTEDFYSRDWGPWFLINGNSEQGIVDFVYEWPGCPGDDAIPTAYGLEHGIPVYDMDLVHAGGNYMTDGQGSAVATDFVWENNKDKTHEEIDDILLDYLGIEKHHVMPDPGWWYHIDCFAKYLSPDTILVAEVDPGHPMYGNLEDAAAHFENEISCYGTPLEVVRIFAPDEPYTNSLILNHKVLVPITGSQYDAAALATYEAAMPGYEVIGLTGPWAFYDALHCRTKEITDRYMLHIHHVPLLDRPAGAQGFPVQAEVIAYSGQAFTGGTPEIYWKTSGGWNVVAMTSIGGDMYEAHIPAQPVGTTIHYYIHAEDGSGRSENHPYIGEPDAHSFTVSHLGSDVSALSADAGGVVNLFLNAGDANSDRKYFVLGSVSGTTPGYVLPGGLTLPLNWDFFTDFVLAYANTAFFVDFQGTLDSAGIGAACLDTLGPLPREMEGLSLYFAFTLYNPFDFVSKPIEVKVLN
jgi:agmatine/peptidylarginine deiminase